MMTLKKHHLSSLIYGFFSFIPLIICIVCIQQNAVNIPIADEWTLIQLRLKAASGTVSWQDIFALHNEHRIATLRLISLVLDRFSSGWNSTLRIAINSVVIILTYFLLVAVTWRQMKATASEKHYSQHIRNIHLLGSTIVVTSIIFFSPSQYENWLSGFQIPWFLINFILISVAFLLYEFFKSQKVALYIAAISLCFVASFSSAHGLFIWLACLPMFLSRNLKRRVRFTSAGIWMGATVFAFATYMAGYAKPSGHPSTGLVIERPGAAIDFFLNLLGNAFGRGGTSNFVIGLVFMTVFFSFGVSYYRQSVKPWNDSLMWFSIGIFPLIFAATTTAGRLGLGSAAALASRYASVTLLLPICLVQLLRILACYSSNSNRLTKPLILALLITGFMFASIVDGYEHGLADARNSMHNRNRGKACLDLYEFFETGFADACVASYVFPAPAIPLELTQDLRAKGMISSPPTGISNDEDLIAGQFDEIRPAQDSAEGLITARGWVFSDNNPGVVLLSSNNDSNFISISNVRKLRGDVARAYSKEYLRSGWEETLPIVRIAAEADFLVAYFYDFQKREIFTIGRKKIVD